jgi:hypothetical protein
MLFGFMLLALSALYVQQAFADKVAHKEYATMKIAECNDCHKTEGVAPNHDADWVRGHRVQASRGGHNCAQCHSQSYCLDCHSGGGIDVDLKRQNFQKDYIPKSHRSDFINIHPIKALDNPQTCTRCHDTSFCNDCHNRFPKGSLRIKSHQMLGPSGQRYTFAIGEHALEARRNLQSCQACHPDGDVCVQCHRSGLTNPHPRNWGNIKGNFRDRAGTRVCTKCHLPGDPNIQ